MAQTTLHLRSETKYLERRTPRTFAGSLLKPFSKVFTVTPTTTKALVNSGYVINIEKSPGRVFRDEEYKAVGAHLVPEGTWPSAPKGQKHWDSYLSRFARGGGVLYDLEFLTDPSGRRVAAFGYHAGFAGAAIALLAWAHQLTNPKTPLLPSVIPSDYPSQPELEKAVRVALSRAIPLNHSQPPRVIITGALGRCGKGAVDCCLAAGVPASSILKWDVAETAAEGPFSEIAASDVFVNCVYLLGQPIPPFVTIESLSRPGRRLRVIGDVSCDPGDANNPIPLYAEHSTFVKPTLPICVGGDDPDLTVISIDHLPSLVAREASEHFSSLLLPSLKALNRRDREGVWVRAEKIFREMVDKLQKAT